MKTPVTLLAALTSMPLWAQHGAPGGVWGPSVWTTDSQASVSLPSADVKGLTEFYVVTPDARREAVVSSGEGAVMTSHRYAEPGAGRYINFGTGVVTGVPQIISCRRRLSLADNEASSVDVAEPIPVDTMADSLCEAIVYHRMLSGGERQRVDTYLALKYAVSLDQTAPSSYVDSRGRVVWDAIAMRQHSHRIAGLCADTVSHLYRAEVTSAEAKSLLSMRADTVMQGQYVICGDDAGSLHYERKGGYRKHLSRTWRVAVTGDAPKLTLSFDASRIEEAFPLEEGEHYWLSLDDTTFVRSADMGLREARFEDVRVRNGSTVSLMAAKGDDVPASDTDDAMSDRESDISVGPNPTTDGLVRLRIRHKTDEAVCVRLYGADGHLYDSARLPASDFHSLSLFLPSVGLWVADIECGRQTRKIKLLRK